jgi:hypothetical protein
MAILKDQHNPSTSEIANTAGIAPAGYFGYIDQRLAQTFVAGSTYTLHSVALRLFLYSSLPNRTFTCEIQGVDGSNKPDGVAIATASIDISAVPKINWIAAHRGANPWSNITFDTPVELTSGTRYAIVCYTDNDNLASIYWTGQTSADSGHFHRSSDAGSNWTQYDSWDLSYQTYSNFALQDSNSAGSESDLDAGGTYWVGQTITPAADHTVKSIALRIKKVGSSIGNVIISIKAAASGNPSGDDIAVATIPASNLTTGYAWHEATLDVPYSAVNGTQYAIVVRSTGATYPGARFQVGYESGGNVYAGGTKISSDDFGLTWASVAGQLDDLWFRIYGVASSAISSPLTDATTTRRLIAIGGNQFWYENSDGDMIVLSDSVDDLDTTLPVQHAEAYGKIFIANDVNLKVADFVNVKIATDNIGTNPPDFDNILTDDTTGAQMVVDYIDAVAGATTIYGRRLTSNIFQASDVVSGTDDDGNAISFTMTAVDEVLPPHWYDWTVYGNNETLYGEMPDKATLVSDYNGRLVLAGNKDYPHEWWMSKVYNPWNWLYQEGTYLTAITSGSMEAGQMGDVITALIPYADDYFVFGCANSVYLLDGDPTIGGTIENLSATEGIYGPNSWCKDNQSNLYFFSGNGLYKGEGGRHKPISLSQVQIPNWSEEWDLNPANGRVTCSFDPNRNGVLVSYTSLLNGSNNNYWYDIKTTGFYPESYPDNLGVFSSFYYNSLTSADRLLLFGGQDGYIRSFFDSQKDDVDSDDSLVGVRAYVTLPPLLMNENLDEEGLLVTTTFVLGGGDANSVFPDSDGMDYELFVDEDAEALLEQLKDIGATAFGSGTLSVVGRNNMIRPRARGRYATYRLSNVNDSETFALNRIYGRVKPVGKRGI